MAKKHSRSSKKQKDFKLDLPEINISDESRNKIIGVILTFFTVFFLLAFFEQAGDWGGKFLNICKIAIGGSVYLMPLVLGFSAYTLFQSEYEKRWQVYLSSFLFILGLSGLLGMVQPGRSTNGLGGLTGYYLYGNLFKVMGAPVSFVAFLAFLGIAFWLLYPHLGLDKKYFELKKEGKKKNKESEGEDSIIKKVFQPQFNLQKVPDNRVNPKTNVSGNKPADKKEEPLLEIKKNAIVKEKDYKFPPLDLLEEEKGGADSGDIKANSVIIKRTLQNFGIPVEISEVNVGPSVTQYAIKPAEGVNIAKISALAPNLSLELSAHPLRIEAPIPGRPLVGIEMPNKQKSMVRLKALLEDAQFQNPSSNLLMALGKDVSGNPIFADLMKMPHMLVAGATGSGKTICLNELLISLLYLNSPNTMRMILVDPKRVEFSIYKRLPHLLTNVIYDAPRTLNALKWLTSEMERRFDVLGREGARDIQSYNKIMVKKGEDTMPYIVFVVDELADLMLKHGKELEAGIVRIAQLARASGIHMILATQRPSVNVITGLIKANIPARVGFRVASQIDSRTILDMAGAEKLLGFGDMLFLSAQSPKPKRLQGAYISEKETKAVVDFIEESQKDNFRENDDLSKEFEEGVKKMETENKGGVITGDGSGEGGDPMYEEAKRIVLETRKASTSFLQRRLRLGYARAARLIDLLEQNGVIGAGDGAKPREVLQDAPAGSLTADKSSAGSETDEDSEDSDVDGIM